MKDWKNKKVLVTGSSGMVGSHLKKVFKKYNCTNIFYTPTECDLTNQNQTKKLFDSILPNIVIHLAARVGGIFENIKYPVDFFEENVLMNTNLLKECHLHNVENVINILSTCIYPDVVDTYPMTEDVLFNGMPQETNFSYAFAKRAMAVQIDAYIKQYDKKWCYLIPCNLYGEYDKFDINKSHFIAAFLNKIKNIGDSKEITLFGTGASIRQNMYAGDLAEIIYLMLDNNVIDNMNIAPSKSYSIKDAASVILNALKINDINITFNKEGVDGQLRREVSNDRFKKHFPDFKFTEFEDGIVQTYNKIKGSK